MHLFAAIGSVLLFLSSLSLAFSDAAWAARGEAATQPETVAMQSFAYNGEDRPQTLDFWRGRGPNAPLAVFVRGGGGQRGDKRMMTGSAELEDWQARGYAVASLGYRPMPQAAVGDKAADAADAVAYLRNHAETLGIDSDRVELIGNSAVLRPQA